MSAGSVMFRMGAMLLLLTGCARAPAARSALSTVVEASPGSGVVEYRSDGAGRFSSVPVPSADIVFYCNRGPVWMFGGVVSEANPRHAGFAIRNREDYVPRNEDWQAAIRLEEAQRFADEQCVFALPLGVK